MLIVHVCGSPASGKTTIGRRVNSMFNQDGRDDKVIVYDLDYIVPQSTAKKIYEISDIDEKIEKLFVAHEQALDVIIKRAPSDVVLVLVGIIEYYREDPDDGTYKLVAFDMARLNRPVLRVFYDPGVEEILRRYYRRSVIEGFADATYVEDVVNKKYFIYGSARIIDDNETDNALYAAQKYYFVDSADAILALIGDMIKNREQPSTKYLGDNGFIRRRQHARNSQVHGRGEIHHLARAVHPPH
jgi:nicotinamide riboside kinase